MTRPPRRILVRVPTWIGDAVMATPVFRALRAAHPEAEIALEGRPVLETLLRGLSSFDRFLPDPGGGLRAMAARARLLREHGFDWAVLLPDSQRAALGPFLARIPRRVGYARDPLRRLLLSESLAPPRAGRKRLPIPMTERYLCISQHLGCPDRGSELELAVDPAAAERCEARLRELGVDDVMAAWCFGNSLDTVNTFAFGRFFDRAWRDEDEFLETVAREYFGLADGRAVADAWRAFGGAAEPFPFGFGILYFSPFNVAS